MYTSIDTDRALVMMRDYLPKTRTSELIIEGLRIVMKNNYFTFDGRVWCQQDGTAMGTAAAPPFAILFLGIAELKAAQLMDGKHFVLNKRYVDDGMTIWNDNGQKFSFKRYLSLLTKFSGLKFTFEEHRDKAVFLDLEIFWQGNSYLTRTHQKALSLHLYIPASSAHPPGIIKGIVFGRVMKFYEQNSLEEDFERMCQKLFFDLQARGYAAKVLRPLFDQAISKLKVESQPQSTSSNQLFLKIPYDPYGPTTGSSAKEEPYSQHESGIGYT